MKAAISSLSFNFDFYDLLKDIDLFDSSLKHSDSNLRQFNETSNFLRNLQHCQHLYRYRKTHLLLFLFNCLNDSIFKWFQKQSHFDNLHIFSTILTKAFSSQKQRELKSIAQKRAKRKVRKIAERTELKIIETAKQTSKFQSIDIFDSTACDESKFELYNEVANFLQNFQQCQHQYRKSDLLNLLSKCLCDFAFEWFKLQSKFTSLKRFSTILSKAFSFAETFLRRVSSRSSNFQLCTLVAISKSMKNASNQQVVQTICKLCKQNFDFNEKLYEHIRNHEVLKLVKNSHLSINAINLIWKIKKKSFVTHVSFASFARFQNSIFEFASTFRIVILLKRLSLSFFTFEVKSKSTEKSIIELSLFASFDIFNSARFHQNSKKRRFNQIIIFIQHLQQCQHLYDESELLEWMKVIFCDFVDIWFENQSNFIFLHDFDIILTKTFFERSNLSLFTLKIESKSTKKSTTCRHCKQTFKFKEFLRKHKREQHAKKFVINSFFRFHALKSVCKAKKKSAVKNVTTLFVSQELQISAQKFQKIDVQKSSVINSSLSASTIISTCKIAKKSTIISIAEASELISEQRVEWRFRIVYLFTRLKASRLNFSLNTFVIISETMKNASIQKVTCARAMCKSCKQNFNFNEKLFEHIREHETLKRVNKIKSTCETMNKSAIACLHSSQKSLTLSATSRNFVTDTRLFWQFVSSKDSNLSITTFKITSKRVKSASIRQVACVRICKHCKQNFNFNNKLHDHIRKHHARKSVKNLNLRVFASEFTYKIIEKSAVFCSFASFTSQAASSISFASSRSQIFSAKMSSRSVSLKDSHLSIATLKITSKSVKKLSANCQLTFSFSSFRISVRKHHESHMQKSYLIMNDLSRMFTEKSKSFDLRSHQDRSYSSQSFDIRQSSQSCFSIASKKSYLIIENLFEMFDEKFRKKSMFQNQKNVFSRKFFSEQSRITIYFKSTVNQKSSISQDSKNSKSKSLNQHMFAKSIRIVFSKDLFEKSINLQYKSTNVFCVKNKSLQVLDFYKSRSSKSRTFAETFFLILVFLRLLSIFLFVLAFVSIISATKMSCINVYEQVVSIIDHVIQQK